jgi:hypothetical protein
VRNTSALGDIAKLQLAAALARSGRRLLRPMSSAARYDLAIDEGDGTITRVQCKTGVLRRGCIVFRVCSTDARRPTGAPYQGQVDAFGIYCRETGNCYLVPMSAVVRCMTMATLRLEPARNQQEVGVRLAAQYEVRTMP